ncbi:MAG: SprT-like domain-containing protein [Gemmatimonadaceae bacterium]
MRTAPTHVSPKRRVAPVRKKPGPDRRVRASDVEVIARLQLAHAEYNSTLFAGELGEIRMRISRRMKHRLGHYMAAGGGQSAEIALALRHLERDPWDDVLHTLVHEMVHQWQDQNGMALDHGQAFRAKARAIGISARATRPANPAAHPRLAARSGSRIEP